MNDVSVTVPQATLVVFVGRPGFFKLLLKNALLSIVTLGFYRFWARTAVRRALWNNVVIAREPLEYTGRGIELFIGFLIAMAVVAPIAAVYAVIQYLTLTSPGWAAATKVAYFAILGVLVQAAIFRARRYRLSRTQWRGIRCWQDGSSWRYVGISLFYGLLTLVTFGLAMPWLNTALQRYKINHTIFGNRRFGFDGRGRALLPRWCVVMAAFWIPLLLFIIWNWAVWPEFTTVAMLPENQQRPRMEAVMRSISGWWLVPLIYLGAGLAWVWYRIGEFRYFVASTFFGDIWLRSSARLPKIVLIFVGYVGCMTITILGAILTLKAVLSMGSPGSVSVVSWQAVGVGLALVAVVYLANSILSQFFFTYLVAQYLCGTIEVENLHTIESVLQSAEMKPRFGEGFADAFDVGAV